MENNLPGKTGISVRIADVIMIVLFAILLVVSAFLSIGSLFLTSVLDINEHITFVRDNIILNIAVVVAFIFLLKYLKRFFRNINPRTAMIVLIGYTTVLGVIWIAFAQAVPRADQQVILESVGQVLKNDYSSINQQYSYYQVYPFQVGILFVYELFSRIFGYVNVLALSILNVVSLDAVYIAVIFLIRLITGNKKVVLLTILLLFACLQPVLFCTFIYGNLIGLALALWAVYFTIKYIKTGKKLLTLYTSALIAFAYIIKMNYSIVLVAICIVLLLHFLRKRGWISLVAIVCAVGISFGAASLVKLNYGMRSNAHLGDGTPQLAWLEMGLQANPTRYFGWANDYTKFVFNRNQYDTTAANANVQNDLRGSINYLMENKGYAVSSFAHKAISEWDEPSFESIWISQVPKEQSPPHPDWVNDLYYGELHTGLLQYFDFYVEIIFIGFGAAMFFAIKKKADLCFLALPLVVLGGFTYHLLFEAKSQYIIVYFIMMIPFAAYGYYQLVNIRLIKRCKKINK